MERKGSSHKERSKLGLHNRVLSAFRERFGEETVVGVNLTPVGHELWITVQVQQKTPPMEVLAQELESELLEEAGRHVAIFAQQPWKTAVANLIRKTLNLVAPSLLT